MSTFSLKRFFLLNLLGLYNLFCFSGFVAETLVYTKDKGQVPIADLVKQDFVLSPHELRSDGYCAVTKKHCYTVNKIVRLRLNSVYIRSTPWQRFYSADKKAWVRAYELCSGDVLLCADGLSVTIDEVEIVSSSTKVYGLMVDETHVFCIAPDGIIVHNNYSDILGQELYAGGSAVAGGFFSTVLLTFNLTPAAPVTLTLQTIAGLVIGGIGLYFSYKKNKQHQERRKTFAEIQAELKEESCAGGNPQDPRDDEKDDPKIHPHGLYKPVSYHHQNSRGFKSPAPKNGQKCLDYSIKYDGEQRLSIEGDTFIVLKKTSHRIYHGHTIEWDKIIEEFQNKLIAQGCVKVSGKIIKEITEKSII